MNPTSDPNALRPTQDVALNLAEAHLARQRDADADFQAAMSAPALFTVAWFNRAAGEYRRAASWAFYWMGVGA